jgi:hypothetical protein
MSVFSYSTIFTRISVNSEGILSLSQAVEHTATHLQGAALAVVQSLQKWLVWLS